MEGRSMEEREREKEWNEKRKKRLNKYEDLEIDGI